VSHMPSPSEPVIRQLFGRPPRREATGCDQEPNCGASGWLLSAEGMASQCKCSAGRYGRVKGLLAFAGIPRDAFDWEPADLSAQRMAENAAKVEIWARGFCRGESGSLLFVGDTGRGKTRLAKAAAAYLLEEGRDVRWYEMGALVRRIKDTFDKDSTEREEDVLRELLRADVLVLDDLGAEQTTDKGDFVESRLVEILSAALSNRRPALIVTTNLAGKRVREVYGERCLSRLLELCREDNGGHLLNFTDIPDFRRRR